MYCPGGPDSDFEYSTQSYTGYEPTSMRAIRARYDPYEQTRSRILQVLNIKLYIFGNFIKMMTSICQRIITVKTTWS